MKVLVAMSGGVDSSVAAALLRDEGHDVVGVTLKLWGGETDSGCCSVSDVEDARRVAAQLDLPHYVFNLGDEFAAAVVDPYVAGHAAGQTPNPCVECNRSIKFGRLLERADAMGFDAVATGHHVRTDHDGAQWRVFRAADGAKDQSYVLYMLGQGELARSRFPVGSMTKSEVRERAAALGLRTAGKPESMDVCFVARDDRTRFLGARDVMRAGDIVDVERGLVGRHDGYAGFTVGQRRGLDLALGERRYVVDVDAATATVTIGRREDLLTDEIRLRDLRFVSEPPHSDDPIEVQCSAHGTPAPARLAGNVVRLDEPRPRVAPGQVVAFYGADELLGGGIAVKAC